MGPAGPVTGFPLPFTLYEFKEPEVKEFNVLPSYYIPAQTNNSRSQWPRCLLRPLADWDCRFEFRWWHGCLSVVSVVCCQVEVSATS
jgi:hypothetical protein